MAADNFYRHGIRIQELATSITPPVVVATPTVVVGSAQINLATEPAPVNQPVLCSSFSEFVRYFGYSDDFNYTLNEAAYCAFMLFNVSPIVVINVLDSAKHVKDGEKEVEGVSNAIELTEPIILSTLKITSGNAVLTANDYSVERDGEKVIIKITAQSKVTDDKVNIQWQEVDASKVGKAEIIGGVDAATGKKSGLELVEEIYARLGLIPGTIIAPKFSTDSEVAAVMKAKTKNINGCFNTIATVDLDTAQVKKYQDANEAKNKNNLVDENLIVCWPMVGLGDRKFHLSTQVACLMNLVDSANDDIPYTSPSNNNIQADKGCLADGTEIFLSKSESNYLNGLGIVTALNFAGGWRCWGNRTAIYPSNSDVKDSFIPVRRMFNWLGNTLVTTFFSRIDNPTNKRLIESIVDSANIYLNGLTARGVLLGGQVSFNSAENSTVDLLSGKIKFHVAITPPVPARSITFELEYDVENLNNLFS